MYETDWFKEHLNYDKSCFFRTSEFNWIKDLVNLNSNNIYPPKDLVFNAFELCSFKDVKVIVLGQDPYINHEEAMGLSFSVPKGIKIPPSLRNIFTELKNDLNIDRNNTDLTDWAKQGILLLNRVLTVEKGKSNSHQGIGWEIFTDQIIKLISNKKENVVFVLWGKNAQSVEHLIDPNKHLIIKSAHPSPFSANKGFFGSKPFSRINEYLIHLGKEPIVF